MGRIKKYTTDELLGIKEEKEVFVSNWLHRGDLMFLKAQKKVGKSIFAQCLAHSCSKGGTFLDEYDVVRPLKVAYMLSEGALVDWKDRIKNMNKMHPYDNDNLFWFKCDMFSMHNSEDRDKLLEGLVDSGVKFDILIWDCLYKFMYGGDTSNSVDVGKFNANEEYIRNHFNAASVVVHHDTEKIYRDGKGNAHSGASVKNAMGSSYLLANVTQVYTMQKFTDSRGHTYNKVVLGDKRSGDLVEELIYYNVVPEDNDSEALGITLDKAELNSNFEHIRDYIKENSPCRTRNLHNLIMMDKKINCSYETFRRAVNKLIAEKLVIKVTGEDGKKHTQWAS